MTGCTTFNPATGRSEFIMVSTSEEIGMGRDVHQGITKQYTISDDPAVNERVEKIGQRLAQVSDRQDYSYQFYVVDGEDLNAFTTPGGNIYIFTGLIENLQTDDQIAAVLAHEVGHCSARHTVKKFQAALGVNIISSILLSQVGTSARQAASLSSKVISNIVFSAYSRSDEFEADRLGIKYMYLAGYNPKSVIEIFTVLKNNSKGSSVPGMLRTHPHLADRIVEAKKEISKIKAQYGQSSSKN